VRAEPGFVATVDDTVAGFLTVARPRPQVAEISWMAVHPDHRGAGHGRALVDALVEALHDDGTRFLAVKTLSDRDPYPPYAETRSFYEAGVRSHDGSRHLGSGEPRAPVRAIDRAP
jgi:ribosomal protein S18 acetylase RimI-like enzyme